MVKHRCIGIDSLEYDTTNMESCHDDVQHTVSTISEGDGIENKDRTVDYFYLHAIHKECWNSSSCFFPVLVLLLVGHNSTLYTNCMCTKMAMVITIIACPILPWCGQKAL